ncbi:MAG: phosphoribosylamine--glycine ligase [Bacteroidetes bacterium]|nr:phosphoribosylamine--glycine ligase [Bacteroidota bacterium]MDA1119165.1 phosphoribosylamine--glycine ligase [Bacteroidota bacterium]
MNILIIGSGGREHAFAWKIRQSAQCEELFVAPGNAGTDLIAKNISLDNENFDQVGRFVIDNNIGLVIVGPEAPLVGGIVDHFSLSDDLRSIPIIGPGQLGATLEGSKDFSKAFMVKHGIPTGTSQTFTKETLEDAYRHLESLEPPYVLKADGLAAGKGVIISNNLNEAKSELAQMLTENKFGEAGDKVVIEEYLDGIELSVFVITDGKNYQILPEAKDYKRIGENDEGPNTGGMGAVSPVHFAHPEFLKKVEEQVVIPTIDGLQKDGIPYKGFIFIGLMNKGGEPYVIEYNVRMGDPETQAVLPRVKSDLVDLFMATWNSQLDQFKLEIDSSYATTVVLVAGGYPDKYEKGNEISGLELEQADTIIFQAGTKQVDDKTLTNGGRVLAVTGLGNSMDSALEKTYKAASSISWKDMNYRHDIGQDLIRLENDPI